ncbi:MAG: hypothetical protein ACQEP1_03180 [Nanobdellota archaeon]
MFPDRSSDYTPGGPSFYFTENSIPQLDLRGDDEKSKGQPKYNVKEEPVFQGGIGLNDVVKGVSSYEGFMEDKRNRDHITLSMADEAEENVGKVLGEFNEELSDMIYNNISRENPRFESQMKEIKNYKDNGAVRNHSSPDTVEDLDNAYDDIVKEFVESKANPLIEDMKNSRDPEAIIPKQEEVKEIYRSAEETFDVSLEENYRKNMNKLPGMGDQGIQIESYR